MTPARIHLDRAADDLAAELDDILGRVLRRAPNLRLEPEGSNWIVIDTNNAETVMLRTPDVITCVRFMHAFARRHPEATVDWSSTRKTARAINAAERKHSVKVPPKLEVAR